MSPTKFPDGTGQVWKLPLLEIPRHHNKIVWDYENDGELLQVLQLIDLLESQKRSVSELYIPFLPYGRQDKTIANDATFGLTTFMNVIFLYQDKYRFDIRTLDVHNPAHKDIRFIMNDNPAEHIKDALEDSGANLICYPDAGAVRRYAELYNINHPYVSLYKVRDQLTGEITDLELHEVDNSTELVKGAKVLIVDVISDGGRTFIETAKVLRTRGATEISLYVTHFLGHGGINKFVDVGIDNIYTSGSLKAYRSSRGECEL